MKFSLKLNANFGMKTYQHKNTVELILMTVFLMTGQNRLR